VPIRVLLVEDDEEDYVLTRKLLKDNATTTFEVTWAQTFEEALAELEHPYDACLVDYRLGAHDGLELLLAAQERGFSAPLILLTGQGDHDIDVQAMKLGAADYLVKDQITPQLMERVIRHSIERRGSKEALLKSELQYRQIVEETTDGIIKTDLEGVIGFVNRRFAELLGREPRDLVGTSVFALLSEAAKLLAVRAFSDRARHLQAALDLPFLHHQGGAEIWCNVAATPLLDVAGAHIGNLGVVRDETERRKLHSQLMVSDRMASVGTLAAGVAHEVNNPLAAVIANLEFITDAITKYLEASGPGSMPATTEWLQAEIKEPLEDAREAARRVHYIVRDLKIFSRSPIDDLKAAVDVKAVMESSLRMAWNEIRHRARLIKHYGPALGVQANEARLGQVFLNLLVNAAQAIPEGRAEHHEIHVSTRAEGANVVIEVRDTGAGIAPEVVPRIFDAFFTTKEIGVGTGLGLAICQRLVADMYGQLTVKSVLGQGTTFRVTIPSSSHALREVTPPPVVAPAPARRGRILVVDDETLVVRGMVRILSREHDVRALVAATEALALVMAGEKFDLILCDLMMPDMTGMELHRRLVEAHPDQADRMIFVTGGAFTEEARQFLAGWAKEHVEMPFEPGNLRALVQRYLR
jgi:PAS domain S-box-containing protein